MATVSSVRPRWLDGTRSSHAQRFGLENGRSQNLREIGKRLGLSHERIRQIERAALEKRRAPEFGASLAEFTARRAQD